MLGETIDVSLRPDTLSADELLRVMRADRTFDVFRRPESDPAREYLHLRPAVVLNDGIVWGFHYERLLESEPDRSVPIVRILPASDRIRVGEDTSRTVDSGRVFAVTCALGAEGRARDYRWDEIDRIVSLCETTSPTESQGFSVPATVRRAIDPGRDVAELLHRYRRLPQQVRTALDVQMIDIRTAEMVPKSLLSALPPILDALDTLSFSDRRTVLRLIVELWRRGDVDLETIVSTVEHRDRNDILDRLRRLRYPEVTERETALARFRDRHARGTGVEIAFPRNYEGDFLTVSFRIRSQTELERRVDALQHMKEEVDDLVGLLF